MLMANEATLCTFNVSGFYLRLNETMNNETRRALTTVDAVTSEDADEKMFGH